MKTKALLSAIFLMVSFLLHAQDQRPGQFWHSSPARSGEYLHPALLKSQSALLKVPQKRNMFNPSNSVWKWDPILSYNTSSNDAPFQRVSRTYNSMGEVLSQLTERRQGSFNWENLARETYTYDSAGNEVAYFAEKWENNAWTDFMREATVYNANGDRLDWRREIWQSTYWWKWGHYTWHYIAPGLYDTVLTQAGPDTLWVNTALEVDTYDTSGNMITSLTYDWVNNGWVYDQLVTNTYDSMNRSVSYISQDWQNSGWVNFYRSDATYDTAGFWALFNGYIGQNNSWVNDSECRNEFDSVGNVLLSSVRDWSGNAWINSTQDLYEYDGSNNLLISTFQNGTTTGWQNTYRQQYSYDGSGNSLTGKWLKWYSGNWHPDNGSLMVYSDHEVDYEVQLSDLYRYTALGDSVMVSTEPARLPDQVRLFPNPARSTVYISFTAASSGNAGSLAIYDLRGRVVLSKQLETSTTGIDIRDLAPGVYFVRFRNEQTTRVLRFIKN